MNFLRCPVCAGASRFCLPRPTLSDCVSGRWQAGQGLTKTNDSIDFYGDS